MLYPAELPARVRRHVSNGALPEKQERRPKAPFSVVEVRGVEPLTP